MNCNMKIKSFRVRFYQINCLCHLVIDCFPFKSLLPDTFILPDGLFAPLPSLV